jgi:hypothetical protein
MSSEGTSDKDRNRIRSFTRRVAKTLNSGTVTCFFSGSPELCDIPLLSMDAFLVIIHTDLTLSDPKDCGLLNRTRVNRARLFLS